MIIAELRRRRAVLRLEEHLDRVRLRCARTRLDDTERVDGKLVVAHRRIRFEVLVEDARTVGINIDAVVQ